MADTSGARDNSLLAEMIIFVTNIIERYSFQISIL